MCDILLYNIYIKNFHYMTYPNIIKIAILILLIVPTFSFAKNILPLAKEQKLEQSKSISEEAMQRKNKMDRIISAIKAMEGNIIIIERSIDQSLIRVEGVGKDSADIKIIKSKLKSAKEKTTASREILEDAAKFTEDMDPKNKDDVEKMKSMLTEIRKTLHESITLAKEAIVILKPVRLSEDKMAVQN